MADRPLPWGMRRPQDMRQPLGIRGVTVPELVITLTVLAVLTLIATPSLLNAYQRYRLRQAAWQMAGDLRLARQRAVTTQRNYRLTYVVDGAPADPNTYIIERQEGAAWTQQSPQPPGRFRFGVGVALDGASTPVGRQLVFDPKGTASPTIPEVRVILRNIRGDRATIQVDGVGTVSVGS